MKKQNFKKVVSLVAGSLVVALVVSIFPGNLLVNAAEISKREARKAALEYVNDDTAEIMVLNDEGLDSDEPFYTVKVKTDDREYEVEINANTKEVRLVSRDKVVAKPVEDAEDVEDVKDVEKFEDFEKFETTVDQDFIEEKDYIYYGIEKPTDEASLNQLLKEGKKIAIAEFKDSGDKEAFKEAKDFLKETKKEAKGIIKDNKKELTKVDEDDDRDDKDDDDKLVQKVKLSEKQALLIALQKINLSITDKQLNRLDVSDDYEKIFNLDEIEIDLDDDKNPSIYEIELKYDGSEYEITVNATSGKILDYEKEIDEDKDDKKVKSKVVEEKDKKDKENNGNKKDENGNNGKNKEKNNNNKNNK